MSVPPGTPFRCPRVCVRLSAESAWGGRGGADKEKRKPKFVDFDKIGFLVFNQNIKIFPRCHFLQFRKAQCV